MFFMSVIFWIMSDKMNKNLFITFRNTIYNTFLSTSLALSRNKNYKCFFTNPERLQSTIKMAKELMRYLKISNITNFIEHPK